MRNLVRVTALTATVALLAAPVGLAGRHDQLPLRAGSAGPRVAGLQWELGGHRPNVFRQVHGTFAGKPNGYLGSRTAAALEAYKFRIGYPAAGQCGHLRTLVRPVAGAYFLGLLRGTKTRPACWVALAAKRVQAVNTGPTPLAIRMKSYELHLLELGIHEAPDGSNRGPAISFPALGVPALQSATGAYGLAWCVSTQQTVLKAIGYGTFADATAGVYYAVDWAARRNLLSAKPKVGALVAFIDYDRRGQRIPGTGHMAFVSKTEASSFTYIAGNDANRVNEHTIADGSRAYVFIYLPRLA